MDSLLEKITLYDILGYLFPGSVLMVMLLFTYNEWMLEVLDKFGDNTGMLYVAFILTSYLVGIAASEMAGIVIRTFMEIKKVKFIKKMKKLIEEAAGFIKRKLQWEECEKDKLLEKRMVSALKKSGIKDDEKKIRENIKNKSINHYISYMYGRVQSSPEYKRIHNYNSVYVMCKNMVIVLIVGEAIMYWNYASNIYIYISCFVVCILFMIRCYRFSAKTKFYAIIWFVEKFEKEN